MEKNIHANSDFWILLLYKMELLSVILSNEKQMLLFTHFYMQ